MLKENSVVAKGRPYIPPPIRTEEHYAVRSLIGQGNSCLIVGLPYMDKIDLLNEVQAELNKDEYTSIFVDAVAVKGVGGFWQSVYQRVLGPRVVGQESAVPLREIAERIESDIQTYVLLINEIDRLLYASSKAVEEFLAGLKTLLNCGTLLIATSYQTRQMWHDSWIGKEVIVTLLGEVFGREIILAPWRIEDIMAFLSSRRVLDSIQDIELRDDLPQLVVEQTGGIPRLVDELVTRLQNEIEAQKQDNWELAQEDGLYHYDTTVNLEAQIWGAVLDEIRGDEALFSGFWESLPRTCRQDLLLAFIWANLEQVGSLFRLSCAEFDRIVHRHFGVFSLSIEMGLFEQDLKIRSNILNEWVERFVVRNGQRSSVVELVESMIREVMNKDFSDAQVLAHYLEWAGMSPRLTLTRERRQHRIQIWNNIAQRVIGFILIGLAILGILRLLRLL